MAMECSSSTPNKNDKTTFKIVNDNAKRSHSKTLLKKAKLSLFKKSHVSKTLIPNVDLDETGQFQENQVSSLRINVKPAKKAHKNILPKPKVSVQGERTFKDVSEEDETGEGSQQICPTCQKSIFSSQMPSHIRLCLKQQFTLVRGGIQDNTEKSLNYQLCQICQKDISHMNSTRRSQHVNKCMDQKEAGLKEKENNNRLLTDAKTAILDCPMCGKSLKTAQSRKNHMKKCAVEMCVSTEKLLVLIKNQEEERKVEIAAGVIPNSLRLLRLKSVMSVSNKEKKPRCVAEPKNQLDEETQLAVALSTSIAEQQRLQEQAIIGQKLKKQTKKSRNRKNCGEEIPLILKLNKEEAKRRIAERVTQLLLPKTPQNSQENMVITPPSSSKLDLPDMSVECEIFRSDLLQSRLWTESGLSDKSENRIDRFYVSALMPAVSIATVKAGTKLRRMSAIPGRRNSEELQREILMKQQKGVELQNSVDRKKNELNTTLKSDQPLSSSPVVTQTAFLLAELAAEADSSGSHLENSSNQQQNDDLHQSGFCPEEPIEIPKDILTPCVGSLQESLLAMVDNPADSDVTIETSDKPIQAHRIFLRSRCPQMLQRVIEGNKIDLSSTSSDVVLLILKYIYAGCVVLKPGILEDVLQLSKSLSLDEMISICQLVIKSRREHPDTKVTEVEEEKGLDVLENFWGFSSDRDSEEEAVRGHSEGGEVKGHDDLEEEDWREMFFTQREHIKRLNSNESLKMEEGDEILSDNSENLHLEMEVTEEDDSTCDDKAPNQRHQNCIEPTESDKEETSSVFIRIDRNSDSDTLDKINSESANLDRETERGDTNRSLCKTDESSTDSEDNCSILDIVDKRQKSNSNSQSSFKDFYLQDLCRSESSPKVPARGIPKDFSNLIIHGAVSAEQYKKQEGTPDLEIPHNSDTTTGEIIVNTVTDVSANLFESDDELFSEGEQNAPPEDNNLKQKLDNSNNLNSQTLSEANSIDNPICLTSGSEVEDDDIHSIGRELKKLESEIVKNNEGNMISVEKEAAVDSYKSSSIRSNDLSEIKKNVSQNVESKKPRFKFVNKRDKIGNKIGKILPSVVPPTILVSDTSGSKDSLIDKSEPLKIPQSKRKIDCDESPVGKNISNTPLIQNKRFKVSTPNCDSNSIVGHDSLLITPIQNQSRRTFMLATPSYLKQTTENKEVENFVAIPIKMIDEFSPKKSKHRKKDSNVQQQSSHEYNDNVAANISDAEVKSASFHGDSDIEIVDDNLHEENHGSCSPKFDGTLVKRSVTLSLSDTEEDEVGNERDKNDKRENEELGMDDVWDGFEDVGGDVDIYAVEIQSPVQLTSNQISVEKDHEREISLDDIPQDDLEVAMNDLEDDELVQAAEIQSDFKTPTLSESAKKRKKKKPWVAPSPFTPIPNYDAMNTPQLQKQISKYGLRPACKKRMKDVLTTIYHETHQYETDSDCDVDTEKVNLIKQKSEQAQQEKEMKSKKPVKGTKKAPVRQSKTDKKPTSKKVIKPPIKNINFPPEGSSDDQLSSSQSSDVSDLPEESFLAFKGDEEEDTEGPKCSKSELHKKLTEYIKSNPDIHTDTLLYKPLEFDVFKKRMTENGVKCSMEKLQEYFDEKGISFTMKNNRKPRKQKRKPKKRKTKPTVDV